MSIFKLRFPSSSFLSFGLPQEDGIKAERAEILQERQCAS